MDHPDKPVNISWALPGEAPEVPDHIISVVVTDQDDEPAGVLEKWSSDAWFYADVDALQPLN